MSCINMCISHNLIIQGSTPTLCLHLDCDISDPQTEEEAEYKDYYDTTVIIKYSLTDYFYYTSQNNFTILPDVVDEESCSCKCQQGCTIFLDLPEEDTIKFKKQIYIQVIAKNKNSGAILETFEVPIGICRKLDRKVM